MFGRFSYGTPRGVTEPGDEFMAEAFRLKLNEAGAAANDSRDTVYVVQATNIEAADLTQAGTDYLEQNFFLTSQIPREVMAAKAHYRQEMNYDWLRNYKKAMDVKEGGQ